MLLGAAWQLPLGSPEVAARLVRIFANSLLGAPRAPAALVLAAYPLDGPVQFARGRRFGRTARNATRALARRGRRGRRQPRARAAGAGAEKCADLAVGVDEEES